MELAQEEAVALAHEWPALAQANGLTIRLTALDHSALLVLGLQEADGSSYNLVLPLEAGIAAEHTVAFKGFGLDEGGEDENGRLDADQLTTLTLADISAFTAAPRPNRLAIDEIVLWQGTSAPFDLSCGSSGAVAPVSDLRVGVDANFIPQGERIRYGFWIGGQRIDPITLLAANGADAFRVRLRGARGRRSRRARSGPPAR